MNKKNKVVIIGAGGHAKVILGTLTALGYEIAGLVDDNPNLIGSLILGYPILGNIASLKDRLSQTAVCAIGDNLQRRNIILRFTQLDWITVIHPKAYVHESAILGKGTVVFAGAVVQPDAILEDHVIINTAASIDHDCHVERFSHIAPGAHLGGTVKIGEGTLIGLGTSIKPGTIIGKWSVIGTGSVVVKNIKSYVYAKGVPAKAYKENPIKI